MCNKTAYTGSSLISTANYCYDTTADSVRYNHSSLNFPSPLFSITNNPHIGWGVLLPKQDAKCWSSILPVICTSPFTALQFLIPSLSLTPNAMVGVHGFSKITQASFLIGTSPGREYIQEGLVGLAALVICRNAVLNNMLDSRWHLDQGANMEGNYRMACSNGPLRRTEL